MGGRGIRSPSQGKQVRITLDHGYPTPGPKLCPFRWDGLSSSGPGEIKLPRVAGGTVMIVVPAMGKRDGPSENGVGPGKTDIVSLLDGDASTWV